LLKNTKNAYNKDGIPRHDVFPEKASGLSLPLFAHILGFPPGVELDFNISFFYQKIGYAKGEDYDSQADEFFCGVLFEVPNDGFPCYSSDSHQYDEFNMHDIFFKIGFNGFKQFQTNEEQKENTEYAHQLVGIDDEYRRRDHFFPYYVQDIQKSQKEYKRHNHDDPPDKKPADMFDEI
jgi:hypothetical protein